MTERQVFPSYLRPKLPEQSSRHAEEPEEMLLYTLSAGRSGMQALARVKNAIFSLEPQTDASCGVSSCMSV